MVGMVAAGKANQAVNAERREVKCLSSDLDLETRYASTATASVVASGRQRRLHDTQKTGQRTRARNESNEDAKLGSARNESDEDGPEVLCPHLLLDTGPLPGPPVLHGRVVQDRGQDQRNRVDVRHHPGCHPDQPVDGLLVDCPELGEVYDDHRVQVGRRNVQRRRQGRLEKLIQLHCLVRVLAPEELAELVHVPVHHDLPGGPLRLRVKHSPLVLLHVVHARGRAKVRPLGLVQCNLLADLLESGVHLPMCRKGAFSDVSERIEAGKSVLAPRMGQAKTIEDCGHRGGLQHRRLELQLRSLAHVVTGRRHGGHSGALSKRR